MAYEDRTKPAQPPAEPKRPHQLSLDCRKKLSISGVLEVESFDEGEVVLQTGCGCLTVRGEGLSVSRLSVEGGDLTVEGRVSELSYEDAAPKQGLWARLFH